MNKSYQPIAGAGFIVRFVFGVLLLLSFNIHWARAQDYFVIGEYDSLTIQVYSGDSLVSTLQGGWDFPQQNGLFLHGVPQSHLIPLPDVSSRKVIITDSVRTFNPLSYRFPKIITAAEISAIERVSIFTQSFFSGIFLALILYHLVISFMVKEQTFLLFVLFLFLFLMVWQSVYGFTFSYIWPDWPGWNRMAPFVLIIIQTAVAVEFTIQYLKTDTFSPQMARTGRFIEIILLISVVILVAYQNTKLLFYNALLTDLLFSAFIIPVLVIAIRKKYSPAYHYLVGFFALLIAGMISILGELGFLEESALVKHASQFGGVIMCISFAVGLAERINVLKKENEQRNQELATKEMENQFTEIALKGKNTMLKEVHHRVKNNLQIIVSLLNLQAQHIKDRSALKAIHTSRTRVKSMSMVHEILCQTENLKEIDIADYISHLTHFITQIYENTSKKIELISDIQHIQIDIKTAIPLGLIINELVSNSFKHAFRGIEKGVIRLAVRSSPDKILLSISDNGTGICAGVVPEPISKTSLGIQLVDDMTKQLNATKKVITSGGTAYRFVIPLPTP